MSMTSVFCDIDDFCLIFEPQWHKQLICNDNKSPVISKHNAWESRQACRSLTLHLSSFVITTGSIATRCLVKKLSVERCLLAGNSDLSFTWSLIIWEKFCLSASQPPILTTANLYNSNQTNQHLLTG